MEYYYKYLNKLGCAGILPGLIKTSYCYLLDDHTLTEPTQLWRRRFDCPNHSHVFRFSIGGKAPDRSSSPVDQELLEIPMNTSSKSFSKQWLASVIS